MNVLTNWCYGNTNIRTIEKDNKTWFVGKDICTLFGDTNSNRSLSRIDTEDKQSVDIADSMNRIQKTIIINESGLYALLFAMQPQKANKDGVSDAYPIETQRRIDELRKFKRWVTSEVLPTIRTTGTYGNANTTEIITPERAAEMLSKNKSNRKINQANVRRIADDMLTGNYKLNGETIKFYADGTLADGQHRLTACVLSGVPFETYVIRGINKDVLPTIDCGKSRSMTETLNMIGCNINRMIVPAMNMYFNGRSKLSSSQAMIIWNAYSDELTTLCRLLSGSHHDHILSQKDVRAFFIHLAVSENWTEYDLQAFINGLKKKPNCETNFDFTCYHFRNWYDKKVHGKLRDLKNSGDKSKSLVTIDALSVVADSYKNDKIYRQFMKQSKAKEILNKGYTLAQGNFAHLECKYAAVLKLDN